MQDGHHVFDVHASFNASLWQQQLAHIIVPRIFTIEDISRKK